MSEITLPRNIICGYFDCSIFGNLKRSPTRIRTLHEIEFYLEDGRITYTDGVAYQIKKGHVRIGSPGEVTYSLLPFKTKFIRFTASDRIKKEIDLLPRYFRSHRPYELEKMLDELITLQQTKVNDILLAGKLLVFIDSIIRDSETSLISGVSDSVLEAKSYIDAHVGDQITLTDISKAVNLSPNYLHTIFKQLLGTTPRDYLTEKRLRFTCELLSTTSLPLSEIAERCGFCNQQYMSQLFKKRFSVTPMEYRRTTVKDYLV